MKTSLYTVLCIVIRFAAVLMVVEMLVAAPGLVVTANGETFHGSAPLVIAVITGALLLAFLLWLFPGGLARLTTGKSAHQVFESPIGGEELQHIALAVLGTWFAMWGLILLAHELAGAALIAHADDGLFDEARKREIATLIGYAVQILLGIVLMLRARGLSALLYRLRYAGLPAANSVSAAVPEGNDQ